MTPPRLGYDDTGAGFCAWPGSLTTVTAGASQRRRSPPPCGYTSHGNSAGDLTRDDVLDNITLYWLTGTGGFVGPRK